MAQIRALPCENRKPDPVPYETASADPVWSRLRAEAEVACNAEPLLAPMIRATILGQPTLEDAIIRRIASRLADADVPEVVLGQTLAQALDGAPDLGMAIRADIQAVYDRDPACTRFLEPVLHFKGFHALQTHRLAHQLWATGRKDLAYHLQGRSSAVFGVDIHPAARFGKGIMVDHATGIVIGETAVVGDNVSMLHGVNLGGNGKECGDRHPKVGNGVLLGAHAKVLGNITIGDGARVAAGSVVLRAVPPHTTVAGIPAKVVARDDGIDPSLTMDHLFNGYIDAGADI